MGAACLQAHPEELLHQRKLPEPLSSQPLPQLQAKCFHFSHDLMPRKCLRLRGYTLESISIAGDPFLIAWSQELVGERH